MLKIKHYEVETEILIFISYFGRTYPEVIGKTFYNTTQSARNKISLMKKKGLIKYEISGIAIPKYAIVLPKRTKDMLIHLGYSPKVHRGNIGQLEHNMLEQICFYQLSKLGEVTRISVWHHKNMFHTVPDLILKTQIHNISIEVETKQKSSRVYKDIINRASKDNFDRVLYVMPTKKLMISIANIMPLWDKLFFIDTDTLIENIKVHNKIKPYTQKQLLREIETPPIP